MTDVQLPPDPAPPTRPAGATGDPGDPLLGALLWLCRHHGQERSAVSLLALTSATLPLTPPKAVQLMQEAGFHAAVIQRAPERMLGLLFPLVLLLRSGDVCIVTRRLEASGRRGQDRYEVIMPGESHTVEASLQDIQAEYSGYALVASPRVSDAAADDDGVPLDPDRHWLWGTLRRFAPYYRSAMVAALLSNVLMLVVGLFSSVVFDRVIPHKAMVTLWSLAIGTAVAIGFDLLARQLRSHLIDQAGKKADLILGNVLFRQALSIRLEHRPPSAGGFAHELGQIEIIRDFSTSATMAVLTDLPFVLLFVAMTFFIAGPLGWVLVLTVPLVLGLSWAGQKMLARLSSANLKQNAQLQGVLVEAMDGLEDIRAAGAQGHFLQRYEESNSAQAVSSLKSRALTSWVNNFAGVAQQLVTVVMLVWGVHLVHDGVISAGAVITAVMFGARAIAPLSSVVSLATRYQGAKAALRMLDRIMKLPLDRQPDRQYLPRHKVRGQMALREVGFSYPAQGAEHAPAVLKDLNLQIQPGQRVAVLGKMGSGKSTILRLLGGLYQPTEGLVEVDGIDLRQIDPVDFRSHVGFMSQEPKLFAGSLRDNIVLDRAHADVRALVPILQLTGLDKVAAAHPLGLDMPVGEGGCLLSGGQRQLVALARCLITRPQVLLLDEPTSAMDAQAEALFVKHLKAVAEGKTLVVVTHRPALLEVVDLVAVVEQGRLLAFGPKGQVMAALAGGKPVGLQTGAMPAVPAAQASGPMAPRAAMPAAPVAAVTPVAAERPVAPATPAPATPAAVAPAPVVQPPPGVAERAPTLSQPVSEEPSVARPYVAPAERRTLPDGVPDLSMPPAEVPE
ncbi:type I secretion system permease/ATPase [Aquabacterium lacunae]|uniref:type I secretion system permease/ATPase n=1 Tax=Aquabacterium lacunae TaxID=2528630 RepID=UPI001A91277F|nr:type I secretion system permease/ATPase [Aquabacterium lacunae]